MRTMKHWALATMAATALALAGCGGGGSSGPPADTKDPPKSALSYATDLNKSVGALMTLAGKDDADGSALKMAKDAAGKTGTETSDGDSMTAMNNAQAVLDAKTALDKAIAAAKADKKEAEDAKADTTDTDVLTALNNAISKADDEIKAAEAIRDGKALAGYVDKVTGGKDADPQGTPASIAKAVAMAVSKALEPTSSADGTGMRVSFGTAIPTEANDDTVIGALRDFDNTSDDYNPVAKANKLAKDNHLGKTWKMIVGEDKVTMKRVGTNNAEVQVASIAGMAAATSLTDSNNLDTTGAGAAGNYMGIPGLVFCLGDDCKVGAAGTADEGKLVGSWYFSPTKEKAYYEKVGTATVYTEELYVNYGHWLVVRDNDDTNTANVDETGQVHVVTYAVLSGTSPGDGSWAAAVPGSSDAGLRAASAKYSGNAVGRSVHKTLDGDGGISDIQSGRFMADVELTATFAAGGSTLGGTIDNFRAPEGSNPDAVDSSWTVTLNAATTPNGTVSTGVTEASGQNGDWTADAYGANTARAVGIFGSFNAHFSDGHAAGAYATRKD